MNRSLVMLAIEKLYPHPDNPRKNLGDLTELSDSIRQNGVMQNLTVVPREEEEGTYTIIIGHRRCAAAKKAGIAELPCAIVELSKRDQIGIMLCENMQRSDITAIEQAESMQLMLDLGETVDSIAASTGFTKKTVKDRLKLNKLDKKSLQKACDRQVTLTDLLRIAELNEDQQADVLAKAGTHNFNDALKRAQDEKKRKEKLERVLQKVSEFARPYENGKDVSQKWRISLRPEASDADIHQAKAFADLDPTYDICGTYITIRSALSNEEKGENPIQKQRKIFNDKIDEIYERLVQINEHYYELRKKFVQEIHIPSTAYVEQLLSVYVEKMLDNPYSDKSYLTALVGKESGEIRKKFSTRPQDLLFSLIYAEYKDSARNYRPFRKDWATETQSWKVKVYEERKLVDLYEFLQKYGYELSDDEKDFINGKHELYRAAEDLYRQAVEFANANSKSTV